MITMETSNQVVSYDEPEEADGLEEYYGKVDEEMPPQVVKAESEQQSELDGEFSDSKENKRDRDRKHSRSHRSRNHKKSKDHDHHRDRQETKKVKKEEQILQDQTGQKNSPKLGEPLIGEDGEILEDGEIADDQEGEVKDDGKHRSR